MVVHLRVDCTELQVVPCQSISIIVFLLPGSPFALFISFPVVEVEYQGLEVVRAFLQLPKLLIATGLVLKNTLD